VCVCVCRLSERTNRLSLWFQLTARGTSELQSRGFCLRYYSYVSGYEDKVRVLQPHILITVKIKSILQRYSKTVRYFDAQTIGNLYINRYNLK
jgi:hypothetical protein